MFDNRYHLKPHLWFLLICLLQGSALRAQTFDGLRVIDESAIAYMEFLSRADFDQRFPGQIKTKRADLDPGWYVIYIHENLNYYFGPILLESIGQDYLTQLTQIVDAAVEQRPDIQDYELALSYEPSTGSFEDEDSSNGSDDDWEGSGDFGDEEQPVETPPQSGFWGFIRRIFGM